MKQGVKTFRIGAGKTALGSLIFLALLFVNYSFVVPWLAARLPEWLAWLGGCVIFLSPVAVGYFLSRTRARFGPMDSALVAAIAGTIFGAIFARHAIFILAVVAITAFPAWTGSKIAALFRPQSDREEGGE